MSMATSLLPPNIHTYHCICSSLLLASTHTLSSLPRRSGASLDHAIILPLPSSPPARPPSPSPSPSPSPEVQNNAEDDPKARDQEAHIKKWEVDVVDNLPPEGYTILLSMTLNRKVTIVRREDGFERRLLWRCGRCRLIIGYELDSVGDDTGKTEDVLKVIYLLPGGIMSTDAMTKGKKVMEDDVRLGDKGFEAVAAWE